MRGALALLLSAVLLAGCDARASSGGDSKTVASAGRVVDRAHILSASGIAEIEKISADLERRRTDQLVVVTLPSLGGKSIEATDLELGNRMGIGQRAKDNGVLVLVAPSEHMVRIEVGHGLEPYLTNKEAGDIIAQDMLPRFRANQLEAGTTAGVRAIVAELDRSPLVTAR